MADTHKMHHQDTKARRRANPHAKLMRRFLSSGCPLAPWCLGGAALVFCLSGLAGQTTSQVKPATPVSKSPQQSFILRSATNEVQVDVRVYDKSGKPVTD